MIRLLKSFFIHCSSLPYCEAFMCMMKRKPVTNKKIPVPIRTCINWCTDTNSKE